MPRQTRTLLIDHTPENLFDLVSDIARYPDFIKWIKAMRVRDHVQHGSHTRCVGEAVVGFRGLTERFSTSVMSDRSALNVEARLVRGPFHRLHNTWTFKPDGEGSRVEFSLDYEFRNIVLKTLAAANSDLAIRRIVESFVAEADRRFGRTSAVGGS